MLAETATRARVVVVNGVDEAPAPPGLLGTIAPRGEGIDGPKNRPDFGMLMLRIMANNPSWTQSPDKVTRPGMEEAVMGPYLPKGEYTTKAAFEASGLKK